MRVVVPRFCVHPKHLAAPVLRNGLNTKASHPPGLPPAHQSIIVCKLPKQRCNSCKRFALRSASHRVVPSAISILRTRSVAPALDPRAGTKTSRHQHVHKFLSERVKEVTCRPFFSPIIPKPSLFHPPTPFIQCSKSSTARFASKPLA